MKKYLALAGFFSTIAFSQDAPKPDLLKNLKFREIGPANMGGRIDDYAVVESNPNIVYAATASGGLWKSVNSGISWTPVFDDQAVSTIGDVTVAQSAPDTVWVGSGEANNRQSSSWGNGVYKSADGGKTWANMGLKETFHIPRIVIHPSNANVVYVAAQGDLWGSNEERGVFKTSDGGKTWAKVLYINSDTGVNDLVMDPMNPDTLYAAAYQRRRTAFGMNGGGPGSGIYRSTDGGVTWKKLSKGLPKGDLGRIGLDVYRRNGNIVYATVEAEESGLYRTEDKGETWVKMSNTNPRPMYFSQVRIDPNNDQRIWVAGVQMNYSEDGGKTFVTNRITRIHVDFHAIWIDPANSDNMIVGCDGGIHFSRDRGRSWDSREQIAIAQFYEIAYDMAKPYKVCGGLQDNSTWCGPSATTNIRGITNEDWYTVQGGDGFYAQIDPEEPYIVYAESQDGNLVRRDLRTHEARSIRPREEDDKSARFRFQWNSPVVVSKHDRKTLYYGGNYVFKSTDQGDNWKRISPDLTSNVNRRTLSIMGMKVEDRKMLSRNDGVGSFPTITTLSESPTRAGILWAGTDDGNLQVSRDGETWKSVIANVPGVPKGTYVSRVLPSAFDAGTAYAAFDGHRSGDFKVYLFKTADYGATWKPITNGISAEAGTLHVIREHPRNRNLLFAGCEFGLYTSFDGGGNWQELKNNLPRVPVDDIAIHPRENDLILATHGRSVWILDSIAALEHMDARIAGSALEMFDVRPATMWRLARTRDFDGHDVFIGKNPPAGAIIDFWTKSKPEVKDVKISVLDSAGKAVATIKPAALDAGVNRVIWNLRADRAFPPTPQEVAIAARFAAAGGDAPNLLNGPMIDPGEYTVEIAIGPDKASKKIVVEEDPRIAWFSAGDRVKRRAAVDELVGMSKQADALRKRFTAADSGITALRSSWKKPDAAKVDDSVKRMADSVAKTLDQMRPLFASRNFFEAPTPEERKAELEKPEPDFVLPALAQRISQMIQGIENFAAAPADSQMKQIAVIQTALADATRQTDGLRDQVIKLNEAMNAAKVPFVPVP
ncbi:MAG: WD40/YVTN/BNR-like repeat-containing protein [Bryobacteraceae bacterium]